MNNDKKKFKFPRFAAAIIVLLFPILVLSPFLISNISKSQPLLHLGGGISLAPRVKDTLSNVIGSINIPKAYIVQSGSMAPAIKTGSVVISYPTKVYSTNDIITYSKDADFKNLVTHRVEARLFPDGIDKDPVYITAGDANEEFDRELTKHSQVVGKVVLTIPYLGYLANFAKQPYGFILLVIVPATIIIYEEFKSLIKESKNHIFNFSNNIWSRIKKKKKKNNLTENLQGESFKDSRTISSSTKLLSARFILQFSFVFFPLFGALLVFTGLASSYFSDKEESTGNVLQAAEFFCNTNENANVVINEVFYDVDTVHNGQGSENKWEWVELFNPSTTNKDVSDWIIEDGNSSDTFPTGIAEIPPCSFAIVSNASEAELKDQTNDGGTWTIPNGTIFITLSGFIGNGLANGGDIVILKDSSSNELDRMSWGTKLDGFIPNCVGSCPSVASGHSLERNPDGNDTNTQTDFVDRTLPTPGN